MSFVFTGLCFIIIFCFLVKRAIRGPNHGIARGLLVPFLITHVIEWVAIAMGWIAIANVASIINYGMYLMIVIWFVLIFFDIID